MNEFKKKDRGFSCPNKAWYKDTIKETYINFGIYPDGGHQGTDGEMTMKWVPLGREGLVPKLECFDDAFGVLASFNDVLDELAAADNKDISPEAFVEILQRCGFKDLTRYDYNT